MKKILSATVVIALVCIVSVLLVACYPSSINAAKTKMSKAGYTVVDITLAEDTEGRKIAGGFRATYTNPTTAVTEEIIVVKYKNGADADDAYFDVWDISVEFGGAWSSYTTCQYNSWIYGGTAAAVAIFKG